MRDTSLGPWLSCLIYIRAGTCARVESDSNIESHSLQSKHKPSPRCHGYKVEDLYRLGVDC